MATFTTHPDHAARFDDFEIDELDGKYLYAATPTSHRVGSQAFDIGTDIEFTGVGFTYSGGALTGGTITAITSHTTGAIDFQISGLSMSVATFNAYQAADDTQGFLASVFSGVDAISGSNQADDLMGYAGNDTLTGNDGSDLLDGGTGADFLVGGKGNDTYVLDAAADVILENGGSTDDWVRAGFSVDLTLDAFKNIEHAALTGGANFYAYGDGGGNVIHGNSGNNLLKGDAGNDYLEGHEGADTLDGGTGADEMIGGAGSDTYYVDSSKDKASELPPILFGDIDGGVDTVISSAKSFVLSHHIENLTLVGPAENGTGNGIANLITGNDAANILDGGGGADTLVGGNGNDFYFVDDAADAVTEGWSGGTNDRVTSSADYTLSSYVERLTLTGGAALTGTGNNLANVITGNSGANVLDGKAGNDTLAGGDGDDILIGGTGSNLLRGQGGDDILDVSAGNDTALYSSALDGHDIIQGFDGNATGGQDKLDLDGYFDALGVDPEDRAERVGLVDSGASVAVWIDVDANGWLDWSIATIQTTDAVTLGQDVLIAHGLGESG